VKAISALIDWEADNELLHAAFIVTEC